MGGSSRYKSLGICTREADLFCVSYTEEGFLWQELASSQVWDFLRIRQILIWRLVRRDTEEWVSPSPRACLVADFTLGCEVPMQGQGESGCFGGYWGAGREQEEYCSRPNCLTLLFYFTFVNKFVFMGCRHGWPIPCSAVPSLEAHTGWSWLL